MKNNFRNNYPIVNLHKKKNLKSSIDTQLLYGDNFKVIKALGGWKKIKIKKDGYIGYIKNKKFLPSVKLNYKVSVLKARIFNEPNSKKKLKKFLPYESRLKITEKYRKFAKFENNWIKISDLQKINFKNNDIFKNFRLNCTFGSINY